MSQGNPRIVVRFEQATIDEIDRLAARRAATSKEKSATRSDFVRQAVAEKIKQMTGAKGPAIKKPIRCGKCNMRLHKGYQPYYEKNLMGETEVICASCARIASQRMDLP